jgi:ubiquinone/menaquinone biosynthesis C-methylase UbiE
LSYRFKPPLFFLCGLAILFLGNFVYSGLNTLSRLDAVEVERDQWQKPSDVIQALALQTDSVVADLGCGSGYFTLKLSKIVGENGRVIAEDIRSLPLWFLRIRALLRSNVTITKGDPNNPHLPARVDAVLISNTYHEFTDPGLILAAVARSLTEGGRLVIVDRAPEAQADSQREALAEHHVSLEQVARDLRQAQFAVEKQQDRFIEKDPEGQSWWLIVVRKDKSTLPRDESLRN